LHYSPFVVKLPKINQNWERVMLGIESGYKDGGYVYVRPEEGRMQPYVVSDEQTQQEARKFDALLRSDHPWAPDRWKPYFDKLPDGPEKAALDGLRLAIEHFAPSNTTVAGILTKHTGPRAFVSDLSSERSEMASWHRKTERGVIRLSAVLFSANQRHDTVFGDADGIVDIDASGRNTQVAIHAHWLSYLPHIDGTTDYTVRPGGLTAVALGGAVRPFLHQNGYGHLWERYISSSANPAIRPLWRA
jgi:hypothetical protein